MASPSVTDRDPATPWLPRSYTVVAGLAGGLLVWHLTRREVGGDYYFHLAGLAELRRSLFDPSHPFLPTGAPEVTFTPYAVVLAAIGHLTGAGAVDLLAWAAPVNLALLFLAFGRFAWRLTGRPATPAAALGIMLVVWGREPWVWSGHLDVGSLGATAAYPSTIAIAALFAALSLVLTVSACKQTNPGPGWWRALLGPVALLAVLAWFVALTHPFTGGWLALLVAVLALVLPLAWRRRAVIAAALTAAGALAFAWPLYPLGRLLAVNGRFDASQDLLTQGFLVRNWPYLLALGAAGWRLRREPRDPLAVLAIAASSVLGLGLVWRPMLVRIDGVAFALLAVVAADEALGELERRRSRADGSPRAVLLVAALAALALVGSSLAVNDRFRSVLTPPPLRAADSPNRQVNRFEQFAFARGRPAGEVLLVPFPLVIGAAAFTDGAKQQSSPWAAIFEPTDPARRRDGERFWAQGTSLEERLALIDRWAVTSVLVPPDDALGAALAERGWAVAWEGPEGTLRVRPSE